MTVEEGQSAVFETAATGFPEPTVQWEVLPSGANLWKALAGATSDRLTVLAPKTTEDGAQYRATFKNVAGKATTSTATLTIHKAPVVTAQPTSRAVEVGQSTTFEAAASGYPTPGVQWAASTDGGLTWQLIEGAISPRLTIANATASQSGSEYRAVFSSVAGVIYSRPATLTVQAAPVITEQPASTIVEVGQDASFQAEATGFPTPTLQWEVSSDGGTTWGPIEGATSDRLTVEDAELAQSGHVYRAVFTNSAGRLLSGAATLTVVTSHYAAVAWGQNSYGQLGSSEFTPFSDAPLPVSGLDFVTAIAAGRRHSLALRADGTVVAWGAGGAGQLGNGAFGSSDVPVAVSGLSGVKAIAAGGSFNLALLTNGTVMSWGANESGELGTGDEEESDVPVPVKGWSGVSAISAGADHSLALLTNGTIMSWGDNEEGELGTGSTGSHDTPVPVKGLSGVTAISAGADFSLALLSNGTVKAWGDDRAGQLGSEAPEEGFSPQPVEVGALTGVTAISAGDGHALALLSNGSVMAWGEDVDGELGNSTIEPWTQEPVQVTGLMGAVAVSAGDHDSLALLGEGSVRSWGINRYGTLGDGAVGAPSAVAVPVVGLGAVASISAGGSHMLAFGEPLPTITAVSPQQGTSLGGTRVLLSGVNFTGASVVMFGASAASEFTVTSDTTAEAVAPPGSGTVDITLRTPAGVSATGAADRFTYVARPSVTKLSVKSGPSAGGTSVTISGSELGAATSVAFAGRSAASFTINSATSITAISPPGTPGTADVTVANIAGTSAISSKDRFKYLPTVEGVTPRSGPSGGGVSVTVTGSGFLAGSGLTKFKFAKKAAKSVSCASSTSCTMLLPAGSPGTVDVTAQANKVKSAVVEPEDELTYE